MFCFVKETQGQGW